MKKFICEVCGKEFKVYPYQRRGKYITCSHKCFGKIAKKLFKGRKNPWINGKKIAKYLPHYFGKKHPRWKGKWRHSRGYIMVYVKKHPFATMKTKYGGYVLEHRLVMEKKLGRFLKPNEVVHHLDGNYSNNNIKNLILFSNHSRHIKVSHSHKRNNIGKFI